MRLKAAKKDKEFAQFQLKLYRYSAKELSSLVNASEWIEDIDLREHLDLLRKKELPASEGVWIPFAMPKLSTGRDFVTPIIDKYLTDIRIRKKEEMFSDKCPSFFLRRNIRLNEIDIMVEKNQNSVVSLIEEAERIEKQMLEEERKRELAANIKKLTRHKLAYADAAAKKRRLSFKGRIQPTLFKGGIE